MLNTHELIGAFAAAVLLVGTGAGVIALTTKIDNKVPQPETTQTDTTLQNQGFGELGFTLGFGGGMM